jgi:hypothetical protein
MSLAWTALQRGFRPPEAILAFNSPTNYEDKPFGQKNKKALPQPSADQIGTVGSLAQIYQGNY